MNQLTTTQDIQVTAQTPQEMREANDQLIQWCNHKISALKVDHIELDAAYKSAIAKKWKHTTLKRHAELAKKRITFYEKIKRALGLGFYIVPSFPVTIFAIRTDKSKPLKLLRTYSYQHEQKAMALPEGEGDYKYPIPEEWVHDITGPEDKAKGKTVKQYWAEKWTELEFPVNMAKPQIMEATSRAMALKLFDDFGVLPSPYRKVDPLIIARIRDPRPPGWGELRCVSFMIAWGLDTKTL